MLPAPWAMKLRLTSAGPPVLLGAASATPAPCTSTTAATDSAPRMTLGVRSTRCGRTSGGRPVGIVLASDTRSTESAPRTMTATLGRATATSEATIEMRVRPRPTSRRMARMPVIADGTLIRPGWSRTSSALVTFRPWSEDDPSRSGIWPSTMLTETPLRKPSITERETKRT